MIKFIRCNSLISPTEELQGQPGLLRDRRLVFCLLSVLAWGLLAHAYGFLHSNFSHDELNAFYATPRENLLKLETGRFFVPAYRALFREDFTLPWVIGLLSLLFIGLSLYLIVRMLKIRNPLPLVLISGILVTNLTVTAQAATYLHELDCNFFALLLVVSAVYLWYAYRGLLPFVGSCALLFLSIGIYQSYFSTAITLMILLSLADLDRDTELRTVFLKGIRGIVILGSAIVGYGLFNYIFYKIAGFDSKRDLVETEGFIRFYLQLLPKTYEDFFHALHNAAYSRWFRPVLYLADLAIVVTLARCLAEKRKEPARLALMAALILLLPLGMNITFLLAKGQGVHDPTYYSVWFVWLLYLLAAFRPAVNGRRLGKILCAALIGVILWQNVLIANTAYMKKEVAEKGTYSVMTRVLDRLEQREDYVFDETEVAFIGTGGGMGALAEYGAVSNLVGMDYNNSIGLDINLEYYHSYQAYFQYVLNYPIRTCGDADWEALKNDDRVQQMPAFPDPDCIRMIDGILVVKMGCE